MEEMSSHPGPRKRKQVPSSTSLKPCNRRITRCQIVGSPPQLIPKPSLKKPKTIHCPVLQNGASPEFSIKDLRARARRVFSPVVRDTGCDLKKKMCNGSNLVSRSGVEMCASVKEEKEKSPNKENLSLGLKDVDMGNSNEMMKNDTANQRNGSISSTAMVRKSLSRGKVYKSPSLFSYRRMLPFLTDMVKEEPSTKTEIAGKDGKVDDSINAGSHSSLVLTDSKFDQHECTGEDSNGTSPPDNGPIQNSDMKNEFKAQGDSDKGMPQDVAEVGLYNVERRIHDNGVTGIDEKVEDHMQTTPPDSNIFSKLDIHDTDFKGQDSFLGCPPSRSKRSNYVPGPTQRNNTNSTTKQVLMNPCTRSKIYASSSSFSYRRLLPFLMDVEKRSANSDPSPQCQKQVESSCNSELPVSSDDKDKGCGFQENQQERCMELYVQPNINASSPKCLKQIESIQSSELFVSPDSKIKGCDFQENQQEKCVELDVQASIDVPSPQCQKQIESSQNTELFVSLDNENEACGFQENQLEKCMELNVQANVPSVDGSSHGVCKELSIPNSEMSPGKPSSDRCMDLIELDMLITGQMEEIAMAQKHAHLNEPHKFEGEFHDAVRGAEVNQLVETPFSIMYQTNLPGDNQPVDFLSNCTTELVCNEGRVDRIVSVNLDQGSSESGEFYNGGSESPTAGILNRNFRGCRGLCSCMNCSSFRLHAERAFEFSRNQMLDAEDVVLMLINELGELRDSLEKSVVDGSDLPDIQLKQLQVRESCKKALAMEQVAKQRLSQMSEDLSAHCRTTQLQRPRVAFSRHVEVKAVPKQYQLACPMNPKGREMVSLGASGSHEDGSFIRDQQRECAHATS